MRPGEASWKERAAAKRASTEAKIPREWLLSQEDLKEAFERRDLTGVFVEKFLNPEEISITRLGSVDILARVRNGEYSSVEVTRAFCRRTAVAQQIVSRTV